MKIPRRGFDAQVHPEPNGVGQLPRSLITTSTKGLITSNAGVVKLSSSAETYPILDESNLMSQAQCRTTRRRVFLRSIGGHTRIISLARIRASLCRLRRSLNIIIFRRCWQPPWNASCSYHILHMPPNLFMEGPASYSLF